jgi:hypothetical protein
MSVDPGDITKTVVRYDSAYGVNAADGTRIPLPLSRHKKVKFPVVVTVTTPQENADYYSVTILPLPYAGFVDKWTDKIANSDLLVHLASTSLPRGAGFACFGFAGAIVGAIIGVLFTPSNISRDVQITKSLDDDVQVVYWVLTEFR